MTEYNDTQFAYLAIRKSNTFADAFLDGLTPTEGRTQRHAIRDYEKRRYEANQAFRDAYLTPASTQHIADENTRHAMHSLKPQAQTRHDYQPHGLVQNVNKEAVDNVELRIDHLRGPKEHKEHHTIQAKQYYAAAAACSAVAATMYHDFGLGLATLAAAAIASGTHTMNAAKQARAYHQANRDYTVGDDDIHDTFRHDLLENHTEIGMRKHWERKIYKDKKLPKEN